MHFSTTPESLWRMIGTPPAPVIVDVRKPEAVAASYGSPPGAILRDPHDAASWAFEQSSGTIVTACVHGHQRSQMASAQLRARGVDASILAGGTDAWRAAGLPLTDLAAVQTFSPEPPSLWVTPRRPKIDRIACPWLIRRFIDPQARFLFVDPPQVADVARETGAVPFDIEGVSLSHDGERCSFDTMLKVFGLESEPALARLALIVRGADTARPDLAPEASGLHAVSLGLSALAGDDDHGLLERGFAVYDALFAWLRFASSERRNWPARVS